jgi:hypothetical protein
MDFGIDIAQEQSGPTVSIVAVMSKLPGSNLLIALLLHEPGRL